MSDMVNHPKHYQAKNGMEAIDVIEAFTDGLNGIEATDTGNIIKYALRWKEKNGVEDLKKIVWYANHLINHLEKQNAQNEEDENVKRVVIKCPCCGEYIKSEWSFDSYDEHSQPNKIDYITDFTCPKCKAKYGFVIQPDLTYSTIKCF